MKNYQNNTEVINLAKNGNKNALKTLLKETEKDVYSYLYFLAKDENEISDMVQEILLKIVKNIKNLKDTEHFRGWLNTTITRHYCDCMRKKTNNKKHIQQITEEIGDILEDKKHIPDNDCINKEMLNRIRESVLRLKEPYKIAIIMREFKGLSYDEIAKLTKTSTGTVKSRIARARNQLKEYIRAYME